MKLGVWENFRHLRNLWVCAWCKHIDKNVKITAWKTAEIDEDSKNYKVYGTT